jgi:hypothetical protein
MEVLAAVGATLIGLLAAALGTLAYKYPNNFRRKAPFAVVALLLLMWSLAVWQIAVLTTAFVAKSRFGSELSVEKMAEIYYAAALPWWGALPLLALLLYIIALIYFRQWFLDERPRNGRDGVQDRLTHE